MLRPFQSRLFYRITKDNTRQYKAWIKTGGISKGNLHSTGNVGDKSAILNLPISKILFSNDNDDKSDDCLYYDYCFWCCFVAAIVVVTITQS